jgi:hypothetical protein
LTSGTRFGDRDAHSATADLDPVGLSLCIFGVLAIPKHDEREARNRFCHPDFFERAILAEDPFQTLLVCVRI